MKRVDREKNEWIVAKEFLDNPLQTLREVEEKTWISRTTVWDIKNNLDKIWQKDDRILWVCEKDFEIVQLWQEIIAKRLKDAEEVKKMRTFEIAQTIEKSEKRYMLFKWEATWKDWWLKDISSILSSIQWMN